MSKPMLIYGLVAACLSTTPAVAFDPPFVWVGQMILVNVNSCGGGAGAGANLTIVFRPKLRADEENSTLSYLFSVASGTAQKRDPTLHFNGSGAYDGSFVTGYAMTRTNAGVFNLIVTPEVVTPSTKFVTFTGSFTNFAGLNGCNVRVRGAAARQQ